MTIRVITVRGTGEKLAGSGNMLSLVRDKVPASIEWHDLEYPASIAFANPEGNLFGYSELGSRQAGVSALQQELLNGGNSPVILAGYSLGGLVISDFLQGFEYIRVPRYPYPKIRAIVNIANPARSAGESFGLPSFGSGIDGSHGPWPPEIPVYEIANPVDVITSAGGWSPWRRLAIVLRGMSFANPGAWFTALGETLPVLQEKEFTRYWDDRLWWLGYAHAPAELYGYLFGGEHTHAYGQPRWRDSHGQPVTGIDLAAQIITSYV